MVHPEFGRKHSININLFSFPGKIYKSLAMCSYVYQ